MLGPCTLTRRGCRPARRARPRSRGSPPRPARTRRRSPRARPRSWSRTGSRARPEPPGSWRAPRGSVPEGRGGGGREGRRNVRGEKGEGCREAARWADRLGTFGGSMFAAYPCAYLRCILRPHHDTSSPRYARGQARSHHRPPESKGPPRQRNRDGGVRGGDLHAPRHKSRAADYHMSHRNLDVRMEVERLPLTSGLIGSGSDSPKKGEKYAIAPWVLIL
jgi:hypothetical protein